MRKRTNETRRQKDGVKICQATSKGWVPLTKGNVVVVQELFKAADASLMDPSLCVQARKEQRRNIVDLTGKVLGKRCFD